MQVCFAHFVNQLTDQYPIFSLYLKKNCLNIDVRTGQLTDRSTDGQVNRRTGQQTDRSTEGQTGRDVRVAKRIGQLEMTVKVL